MVELSKDNIKHEAREAVETLEDIVCRDEHSKTEEKKTDDKPKPKKTSYDKIALMALIVSIIAWGIMLIPSMYSGYVALGVAVLSIVLAAFGLRSKRRGWRDTATTALIIGGVLSIVIVSFIVVIYVGLEGM